MSTFFDSLPVDMAKNGRIDPAYIGPILERVRAGQYDPIRWSYATSAIPGHTATFAIMSDAMKLDGVRFALDAAANQLIADQLGCLLVTPRLADLSWFARAVTLAPVTLANTPQEVLIMSHTKRMLLHSQLVDDALARTGYTHGFVRDVGKFWCLGNALSTTKAINYGFFSATGGLESCVTRSMGPCRVIQGPWTKHDPWHVDYSQVALMVSRQCVVDGQNMDLAAVLRDPALAPLASHEGVLKYLRQPGVTPISVGGTPNECVPSDDGTTVCPVDITGLPPEDEGEPPAAARDASYWKSLLGGLTILGASVATAFAVRKYMARRAAKLLQPSSERVVRSSL